MILLLMCEIGANKTNLDKKGLFFRDWVDGDENGFFCQIFPVLFYGNTAATLFNIMAVTINRSQFIFCIAKIWISALTAFVKYIG